MSGRDPFALGGHAEGTQDKVDIPALWAEHQSIWPQIFELDERGQSHDHLFNRLIEIEGVMATRVVSDLAGIIVQVRLLEDFVHAGEPRDNLDQKICTVILAGLDQLNTNS